MKIVVTIPAYNEAKTIGRVIDDIKSVMRKTRLSYKILLVDDGSKDSTGKIAEQHGAAVVYHPVNYGLAETFKTEISRCISMGADVIVHIDADGQYKADEIPLLLNEIENGNDLVLGNRFRNELRHMPYLKRWGNRAFSKVLSNICRIRISDGQTGFRAFTRKVAADIKIISNHTYTQEQIIKAARHKFRIKEVPVTFNERKGSRSRLMKNPIDYAVKAWLNIFRIYRDYEPMKFFGMIGGMFFLMGIMIGLGFVYLHFTTGIKGHLGLFFLMVLLVITGIQTIIFGFMADMIKTIKE